MPSDNCNVSLGQQLSKKVVNRSDWLQTQPPPPAPKFRRNLQVYKLASEYFDLL